MALEGTLKNRNGALYVLYTFNEDSEPIRQHIWYRVLETRGTGYGERPEVGDQATRSSGGEWRTRNPATHRPTGSVSTGTGSTLAELVERVSIPPPATGGKELRWRDGRWEKLTARGWGPAGEGRPKTPKKTSAHATTKQHPALKTPKTFKQLNHEIAEALQRRFVAVDPRTGLHLREATSAERARYLQQPGPSAFRKPVRVGKVLIDEDTGPGLWHGGAGF